MQGILFDKMYNLEVAINQLTDTVKNLLYDTRTQEAFQKYYAVETLCSALTEIKCSISTQLREECETPFKD